MCVYKQFIHNLIQREIYNTQVIQEDVTKYFIPILNNFLYLTIVK